MNDRHALGVTSVRAVMMIVLLIATILPMAATAGASASVNDGCERGRRIRDACVSVGAEPVEAEVCRGDYRDVVDGVCVSFRLPFLDLDCASPYYSMVFECHYDGYHLGEGDPVCPETPSADAHLEVIATYENGGIEFLCSYAGPPVAVCGGDQMVLSDPPYNGQTCAFEVQPGTQLTCPAGGVLDYDGPVCLILEDVAGTQIEACSTGVAERIEDGSYRCTGVGPTPTHVCSSPALVAAGRACFQPSEVESAGACVDAEAFYSARSCWTYDSEAAATCAVPYELIGSRCLFSAPAAVTVPPRPNQRPVEYFDLDNQSRQSIVDSYRANFEPALSVLPDWTGSVGSCNPGEVSDDYRYALLTLTNWMRALTGLRDPVRMDASYIPEVQASSLIMTAQGALSHFPPEDWPCWSAEGYTGASRSNLTLTSTVGADASRVLSFIFDYGDNNRPVGHRWWAFRPGNNWVEFGATSSAISMWVVDPDNGYFADSAASSQPTLWPPAGYFPESLMAPRFSVFWDGGFSEGDYPVDLQVRVNGALVDAVVEHKASDRLVFALPREASDGLRNGFSDRVVDVSLKADSRDLSWRTIVIDPDFDAACDGQSPNVFIVAGDAPTEGPDVILGGDGNDVIDGLGGDDIICGGLGNDIIRGGAGNDLIIGGGGDDQLLGGDGNDVLRGNAGNDEIKGQVGSDRILGGIDDDLLIGGGGSDFIGGYGGADTIEGGSGADIIFGGFGADSIDGGPGDDKIHGLVGNDIIRGGPGNDELDGDRGRDTIDGDDGDDVIRGGNSDDVLNGGPGNDDVSGGRADDWLAGGPGASDTCTGNKEILRDVADPSCERIFGIP